MIKLGDVIIYCKQSITGGSSIICKVLALYDDEGASWAVLEPINSTLTMFGTTFSNPPTFGGNLHILKIIDINVIKTTWKYIANDIAGKTVLSDGISMNSFICPINSKSILGIINGVNDILVVEEEDYGGLSYL